jgi:hypothetical protein
MIREALLLLQNEVRRYFEPLDLTGSDVMLGNVALADEEVGLQGKLLLTLVNIEEESTLKNGSRYIRNTFQNSIEAVQPAVFLNLYILFSATLPKGASEEAYKKALQRISAVVELFQFKKEFTLQNSPGFNIGDLDPRRLNELRLHPELYTLTFEQINHMWGALGGKQSPSAMYKVRLVKIQRTITEDAPLIKTIQTDATVNISATI